MSLASKIITSFSAIFTTTYNTLESILSRPAQGNDSQQDDHTFQPPKPTDKRSPCPMVNALANHNYLPRDGTNVSLLKLIQAAKEGINLAPDATLIVGLKALQTSTTGGWFTFNLDDLNKHGIIEHDGSLSRKDVFFGDNHSFSPETWATVFKHFHGLEKIPIDVAANARKERLEAAKASNPEFNLTPDHARFSVLETCLYLMVFGEGAKGNARTDWVRVLFEQERLPFQEGFKRSESMLTVVDILELQKKVEAV
ncbi:putative aromatic peroxygenase [Triangularia verruculosa]|uniref:Aromatic peroxygenase n=1 Tax=Triangularia verruculosa TaxID=2587418 RepID=A0AAN7AWB3_9PEZI|nr:putative aromatic peroxygenase [Triangularia verruculosa]